MPVRTMPSMSPVLTAIETCSLSHLGLLVCNGEPVSRSN
ncbi:hypothetical protein JMJ77_0001904 [Colletotrichum scovillei]|uniref:Uncharacterized protein n=1 Tax=Colletotrichum scovillei TaxID=1209932 RepID=A0A9P7R9B9_9PEZI|nr:hypothetical protein JMJ77_0001904 [Colletotrichum scovillei]KAG7070315.1 hypothetical protein JMJ76_0001570 [Colletotrichum scovillei]KAG7078565.1 hypothetical protein JMJ78_0002235 [Colletotrichum scovillei]